MIGYLLFMVHSKVLGFEEEFGLVFRDKELLLGALDHTKPDLKKQYAVAGDKLLDYLLFDHLMPEGYLKGKLDCIRQKLNNDVNLARIGRDMGLGEFIVFPDSAYDGQKLAPGSAFFNDTLEALVYVIMKDYGLEKVTQFVEKYVLSTIPENEYGCE